MIWEDFKIISFEDFYRRKKTIRNHYRQMSYPQKRNYKNYIYSDEFREKETDKDCIWNYLNENENCKKELVSRMEYRKRFKK